jgi:hypothetical protein
MVEVAGGGEGELDVDSELPAGDVVRLWRNVGRLGTDSELHRTSRVATSDGDRLILGSDVQRIRADERTGRGWVRARGGSEPTVAGIGRLMHASEATIVRHEEMVRASVVANGRSEASEGRARSSRRRPAATQSTSWEKIAAIVRQERNRERL